MTFEEIIEKLKKHDITKLFNSYTVIEIIEDLRKEYEQTSVARYKPVNNQLLSSSPLYAEQFHPRVRMTRVEFDELETILINAQFDYSELKKTIEIVPNKKWFVRSKKEETNGYGWLSIIDKYATPIYQYSGDKPLKNFPCFDTKEEAELWTNPLTEAVILPV